jgi:hypothetical protein
MAMTVGKFSLGTIAVMILITVVALLLIAGIRSL